MTHPRMICLRTMLLAALIFSGRCPTSLQAADAKSEETWSVIYLSGQRVGYGRTVVKEVTRDGSTVFVGLHEEHITIRRFGQELKMQTKTRTEENADGKLLKFSFEMHNPPAQAKKSSGRIDRGQLVVDTTVAGRTSTRRITIPQDVRSPLYQERVLKKKPLKPGDSIAFRTFSPELAVVADIRISADDYREVKLHDGSKKKLLKLRISQSVLPGIAMRSYVDEEGNALRSEADLLGMVSWVVPQEVALQEIAGQELDVAVNALLKVKNPPSDVHRQNSAVYRIQTTGRDPSDIVPEATGQKIRKIDDETIELTMTAVRPKRLTRSVTTLPKEYLGSTAFLQTDDARVREHARKAASGSLDPATIAIRMEEYVHKNLKKKNFSTALASAAEVAKNMEGDCTEHACLLAAMLRTQRVPSRVAVGLVYAERYAAFAGHMWTEAWLAGEWIPLDATLGKAGIGVGHIKLADSDLSDGGPAPVTSFLPLMNLMSDVTVECISIKR